MLDDKQYQFSTEIVLNEYTLREILLSLWTFGRSRGKGPVIILLLVLTGPLIYGFVSGRSIFVIGAGLLFVPVLICFFVYVCVGAYRDSKKRESQIRQFKETYGAEPVYHIFFGDNICYDFCGKDGFADYSDINKVIILDMYLILQLKHGLSLPVWKAAFSEERWNAFLFFLKQKQVL